MEITTYDPRLDDALAFVAERFRHKARKATRVPYLSHLLAVTALVMEHGGDADQMVAAALHDYLEDIPGASLVEIEERFGRNVARLVDALSDHKDASRPKAPWKERKSAHVEFLRSAGRDVKLVSACDKLHNARSLVADQKRVGDEAFSRFNAPKNDTLWYYRAAREALGDGYTHDVLEELDAAIDEMHRLAGALSSIEP
jgi:(p)ppGpp synthase/HD superfamily hydrolase